MPLLLLPLLGLLGLYAWYFAAHARAMLGFPYPFDYGEGPLLLQARLLQQGSSLAALYGDPALPPYAVVNYPPLYLLLTVALAPLAGGDALLAGRLLSLGAALGCALALALLVYGSSASPQANASPLGAWAAALGALAAGLAFLALPVVRQWAALLRVDMLGVCLGLWALLALLWWDRRLIWFEQDLSRSPAQPGPRPPGLLASLPQSILVSSLLVASLFVKPSLVAAPLAACLWMLLRRPRLGLLLIAQLGLLGGGLFLLLNALSGGWFFFHVVSANANRWEAALALQFWREQLVQLWPLLLLALLAVPLLRDQRSQLALLYTLGGALTAIGVGKVGAYANYFLELHAGLLWLAGLLLALPRRHASPGWALAVPSWGSLLALGALLLSFARFYPLWDPLLPRQAGLLSPNPPRRAFGDYGLREDLRRGAQLLPVFAATQEALSAELRGAPQPLLSDTPGLLVAAGALPRIQAFEHRQLLDQGLWAQGGLLLELANGELPLTVVDYLGNWLSPEMVTLLRHRYAMDGSLGIYSIYRPVALGPRLALPEAPAAGGVQVSAYHLALPPGQPSFAPGQILPLALELRRVGEIPAGLELAARLSGPGGPVVERALPPLYGAIDAETWPEGMALQHVQPLTLPPDLAPGSYRLELLLRAGGADIAPAQLIASVEVAPAGAVVGDQYLPQAMLEEWRRLGGEGALGPGLPMMPAVPFERGMLQCFERACLDLRGDGSLSRRPLGEIMALDAAMWPAVALPSAEEPALGLAAGGEALAAPFAPLWLELGGLAGPGAPVSAPLERYGLTVQYTSYARLELAPDGSLGLGRVGDDYLRRPPGVPYGWPAR